MTDEPEITWHEIDEDGTADLWIDGRIVEYDVPEWDREGALRRARVAD